MNIAGKIIKLTRPYWKMVFVSILLSLMVSGITAAIAWSVKPALDEIFADKKYEYLKLVPAAVFLLFAFKGTFGFRTKFYNEGCRGEAGKRNKKPFIRPYS